MSNGDSMSTRVALVSAVVALVALVGSVVSWQRDSAMPWIMQWIDERGQRLKQLEERLDNHERMYHSGRHKESKLEE